MSDDTGRPFHCPAQECQQDQAGLDFGDAKRLYIHWISRHKPRCPRTDCKYSVQDLSKTSKSYFLRHWSTYFPHLNTGKSACDKCGRPFPNAANRDRHATKCGGQTTDAIRSVEEATYHELELEHAPHVNEHAGPKLGAQEWSETIPDPRSDVHILYEVGVPPHGELMPLTASPGEPSLGQTFVPTPRSQLSNPITDSEYDYAMFEKLLASPWPCQPFPDLAHDQRVFEDVSETTALYTENLADRSLDIHPSLSMEVPGEMPSSSRKRVLDDTTMLTSKRHQPFTDDVGSLIKGFAHTDVQADVATSNRSAFARASESTTFQGSNDILQPTVSKSQSRVSTNANNAHHDAPVASSTFTTSLPLRPFRQYTPLVDGYYREHASKSRYIEVRKQVIAVKTYDQSTGCSREVSCEHHTWVRKLVRKPREITDATSLLVNDILVSKKTRYPRVRDPWEGRLISTEVATICLRQLADITQIIDDDSPIFEYCANGNYDEVNRLLSLRKATIMDVDFQGRTLLHVGFSLCRDTTASLTDIAGSSKILATQHLSASAFEGCRCPCARLAILLGPSALCLHRSRAPRLQNRWPDRCCPSAIGKWTRYSNFC